MYFWPVCGYTDIYQTPDVPRLNVRIGGGFHIRSSAAGRNPAKAVVGFDYQDKMTGSIEMDMIKEGDIWKIDGLSSPKFEKFTLKTENE